MSDSSVLRPLFAAEVSLALSTLWSSNNSENHLNSTRRHSPSDVPTAFPTSLVVMVSDSIILYGEINRP